jgi:hypothetical protein
VYFALWEATLQDPSRKLDTEQYKASALKAIRLMRTFERVFPIGQPTTPYYQGCYAWLTGEKQQAVRLWNRSLVAAQKFNMIYEEGLARLKLGLAESDPEIRGGHFQRAIEIFEQMGATHELCLAQEAAKNSPARI